MMSVIDKSEEKEKIIVLLWEQMRVEGKLVELYEDNVKEFMSALVRHLLYMINPDS